MVDRINSECNHFIESPNIQWKPLEVYQNFQYSENENMFTPPFATKEEAFGFLSGSESTVLCSKKEPIYSENFVQCAGALVKNKKTGLVSVIHQLLWSASASLILALQRPDDLDIVTITSESRGSIGFSTVKFFHEKNPLEYYKPFASIDRTDWMKYNPDSKFNNLKHVLDDFSQIKGITTKEVEDLFKRAEQNENIVGKTRLIGDIKIPVSREESNRWSLLYRPKENVIWIYESGIKKLFKYPGFSE